jgi:hypothetical protein
VDDLDHWVEKHAAVKAELKKLLPTTNRPELPRKKE